MSKFCAVGLIGVLALAGCAAEEDSDATQIDSRLLDEAPIGESNEPGETKDDAFRHNGEDDYSETCKPLPDLEPLNDPEITISVDGLTLHLRDRDGDYDAVFPIGVGKIGDDAQSLTPLSDTTDDGLFYLKGDVRSLEDAATSDRRKWGWNYSCRIWSGSEYYNPATGEEEFRSYFAGLPFLRFEGPERAVYGIHGPIDNYWRENGGELYAGYVSGGCIRMQAADVLELAALISGHRTPVKVQRELEMGEDGLPLDDDRFISSHCNDDSDCADESAICVDHPDGGQRFCTAPCESTAQCPIRENSIVGSIGIWSYCVNDTHDLVDTAGYCVVEGNRKTNNRCTRFGDGQFRQRRLDLVGDEGQRWVCTP